MELGKNSGLGIKELHNQIYTDRDKCMQRLLLNDKDNSYGTIRNLSMAHGESLFTEPTFYVFTEEHIPEKFLKSLDNIKFNSVS